MLDLHALPQFAAVWLFLHPECVRARQDSQAIALLNVKGRIPVPSKDESLSPRRSLNDNWTVVWHGEEATRSRAMGSHEMKRAANLMEQARARAAEESHLEVVKRLQPGCHRPGGPATCEAAR
jgi:hypothetical protein